jgi:Tfp pilus assembly protein PilO
VADFAVLIPIFALAIPVAAIVFHGLEKVWRLRVEEARAKAEGLNGAGASELADLRADVAQLRQELDDVQERLDFTERALAQSRERPRLSDGQPGI